MNMSTKDEFKNESDNVNVLLPEVSFSSLVEKSRIENAENRCKMYSNINKTTKDIEPFENTAFLEMVSAVI